MKKLSDNLLYKEFVVKYGEPIKTNEPLAVEIDYSSTPEIINGKEIYCVKYRSLTKNEFVVSDKGFFIGV